MRVLPVLGSTVSLTDAGASEERDQGIARAGLAALERVSPRSVRLSLTDRCDLACVYCRPHRQDGYFEKRLDIDAWRAVLDGLIEAGVRRVRITGGEPLLYRDLAPFIAHLATLPFEDLALTTNATQLEHLARPLRDAGLQRLNISIDSLNPARFARMTRGGDLAAVLRGIEAAVRAGYHDLKLNAVVLRGENEEELLAITQFAWDRGITPRFLEVMAIGEGAQMQAKLVTAAEIRARLAPLLADDAAVKEADRGPAVYVPSRYDPKLRVGFITGASDTFCAGCDRLRISAEGDLRPCLATDDGIYAVTGADMRATAVAERVRLAWLEKPDGSAWKGCTEPSAAGISMRSVGG
jgi:GTP 3',8-cyclase